MQCVHDCLQTNGNLFGFHNVLLYGLNRWGGLVGQEFFVPHTAVELLILLPRSVLLLALQDRHLTSVCDTACSDFVSGQLEGLCHGISPFLKLIAKWNNPILCDQTGRVNTHEYISSPVSSFTTIWGSIRSQKCFAVSMADCLSSS